MRSVRYILCLVLALSLLIVPVLANAQTQQLLGDINGDGKVTTDDAIQLLLHVSLPSHYPISVKADFNGDGKVNTDDVIRLVLHISMPNKYPLESDILEVTPGVGDNRN